MFIIIKNNNKLLFILNCKKIYSFLMFFGIRSLFVLFNLNTKIYFSSKIYYYQKEILLKHKNFFYLFNNTQESYDKKKYLLVYSRFNNKLVRKVAYENPFKKFLINEAKASKVFFYNTKNTKIIIYRSYLKRKNSCYKTDSLYIGRSLSYQVSKYLDTKKVLDILTDLYADNFFVRKVIVNVPNQFQSTDISNILSRDYIMTYSHGDFISWNIKKIIFTNKYIVSDYEFSEERTVTYDYFYFYTTRFIWSKNQLKILEFIKKINKISYGNFTLEEHDLKKYYIVFLLEFYTFFSQHSNIMLDEEYDKFIFELVGLILNER